MKAKHIAIIDPAVRTPELDCFNQLSRKSPASLSYHLPALFGMGSLFAIEPYLSGLIILGSASSVNDQTEWQTSLENWLKNQLLSRKPTFGFCYGHQMIAHLFGGKVDFLFPDKHKLQGFREVQLSPNILWQQQSLKGSLYVSHREAVTTCPNEMEIVGRSAEVQIDALVHKRLPIWSLQAHPEATPEFLKNMGDERSLAPDQFSFGAKLIQHFFDFISK